MRLNPIGLVGVAAVTLAAATSAQAALIANWNFGSAASGTQATLPIPATRGTGSLTSNFVASNVTYFTGSTVNAVSPDTAGADLAFVNQSNNGRYFTLENLNTTGQQDLIFTAALRRTGTGFTSAQVQYSVNGGAFTNFGSALNIGGFGTTHTLWTINLSSLNVIENISDLDLRFVLNGSSSSSGNIRLDNIQVNGTAIPQATILAVFAEAAAGTNLGSVSPAGSGGNYVPAVLDVPNTTKAGSVSVGGNLVSESSVRILLDLTDPTDASALVTALNDFYTPDIASAALAPFSALGYHVSLTLANGATFPGGFFNFDFNSVSGFDGVDRILVVPEPSALGLAVVAAPALLRRRRA